jgi:hypothetical protein
VCVCVWILFGVCVFLGWKLLARDELSFGECKLVRGRHQQEIWLGFLGIRFEGGGKSSSSRCRYSISRRQRWDQRNRRKECNELACLLKLFVSLWWWR